MSLDEQTGDRLMDYSSSYQKSDIIIHHELDDNDVMNVDSSMGTNSSNVVQRYGKRTKFVLVPMCVVFMYYMVFSGSSSTAARSVTTAQVWHPLDDGVMGGKSKTQWHPLDDYVMGGKSKTQWEVLDDGVMGGLSHTNEDDVRDNHRMGINTETGPVLFTGFINTNGGGFTSIRTNVGNGNDGLPEDITAVHLRFRGDGKTYKIILTDGTLGGPNSATPTWEADVPTTNNVIQEVTIPLSTFVPRFAYKAPPSGHTYTLVNSNIHELGVMLSLLLMDGSPNPPETFGEGIFDFRLEVEDIQFV